MIALPSADRILARTSYHEETVVFYRSGTGSINAGTLSSERLAPLSSVIGISLRQLSDLRDEEARAFFRNIDVVNLSRQAENCAIEVAIKEEDTPADDATAMREPLRILRGHTSHVSQLAYSTNGRRLFSCDLEGGFRVWQPQTGETIINDTTAQVTCFALSNDGLQCMTGHQDSTVKLRHSGTGALLGSSYATCTSPVQSVVYANENRWGVAGGLDGFIHIFEIATRVASCPLVRFFKFEPWTRQHGPFTRFAFTQTGDLLSCSGKCLVFMTRFVQQVEQQKLDMQAGEHDGTVRHLAISSSRIVINIPTHEGVVLFPTDRQSGQANLPLKGITALSVSPDGDLLALLKPGLPYSRIFVSQTSLDAIFNPASIDSIASASILVYKGNELATRILYPRQIVEMCLSPDGQSLALVIAPGSRSEGYNIELIELDIEAENRRSLSEELHKLTALLGRISSQCNGEDQEQVATRLQRAIQGWLGLANQAIYDQSTPQEKANLYVDLMYKINRITIPFFKRLLSCSLANPGSIPKESILELLQHCGPRVPVFASPFTEEELGYIQQLAALPLESILDRREGEARCKAIGQAIFDAYKRRAQAAGYAMSEAGKKAVQRICNALPGRCSDGRLRKEYVERAWDGVGDSFWRWCH